MKIKLAADSSSNVFSLNDVEYGFAPLKIVTEEKEYADTPELDLNGMIEDLRKVKGRTGTSCPNTYEWKNTFEGGEGIFAVTITSNLSGSYSSAMQAKEEYEAENPGSMVHIIDSRSAGPEMGLILEKLREYVLAGMAFDTIKQKITEYCKHTHLLFSLESLANLARNGRVSPAVAKIAGVLGIRVVGKASDEGTLEQLHKCRGEKKAIETIWAEMKLNGYQGGRTRISHCLNLGAAEALKRLIKEKFADALVEIEECTALCSFYAEKGGMMVGYEDVLAGV